MSLRREKRSIKFTTASGPEQAERSNLAPMTIHKLTNLRLSQAQRNRSEQDKNGMKQLQGGPALSSTASDTDNVSSTEASEVSSDLSSIGSDVKYTTNFRLARSQAPTSSGTTNTTGGSRSFLQSKIETDEYLPLLMAKGQDTRRTRSRTVTSLFTTDSLSNSSNQASIVSPVKVQPITISTSAYQQPEDQPVDVYLESVSNAKTAIILPSLTTTHPSNSLRRPESRSSSRSTTRSRSSNGRYPPVSFPSDFYDKYSVDKSSQPPLFEATTAETPLLLQNKSDTTAVPSQEPTLQDSRDGTKDYDEILCSAESLAECPTRQPAKVNLMTESETNCHCIEDRHEAQGTSLESCMNCDVRVRRKDELNIVIVCTKELMRLTHELSELVEQLEKADLTIKYHETRGLVSDSIDQDCMKILSHQICELEEAINDLRSEQNFMVERVWSGFARRWGADAPYVQHGRWTSTVVGSHSVEKILEM